MANCKRKRTIAAIMALAIVAGAAPAKPISDLIMPELSVSAAEATSSVSFTNFNVAAGGKLTAKFHVNVPANFASADTAYVKITCAGETVEKMLKQVESNASGVKTFGIDIAAKQMTDDITCEVYASTSEKTPLIKTTQSVKKYAEWAISSSAITAVQKKVFKAMLNYGAYAQTYFKYNTSNLANSSLTAAEKNAISSVKSADIAALYTNGYVLTDETLGSFTGIGATLESETELNMTFKPAEDVKFRHLDFFCTDGGTEYDVEAVENEDGTVDLKIRDIAAKALGKDLIVSVANNDKSKTVSYKCSINTYIKNTLALSKDTALKNSVAALYLYNQAAVENFDAERLVTVSISGTSMNFAEYTTYDSTVIKAVKETVVDAEENSTEKFLITIPAKIVAKCGISDIKVTYASGSAIKTIDAAECEANYDETSCTTTVAINASAVPAEATNLNLEVKVSESLGFNVVDNGTGKDDKTKSTTVEATNKKPYYGEEFVTYLETVNSTDALPGTIEIYNEDVADGTAPTTDALVQDKDYTYDSSTGKVVIFAPTKKVTIAVSVTDAHVVSTLFRNLTTDVTTPMTVGNGFSMKLTSTDTSKYKVPTEVTLYGATTAYDNFYSEYDAENEETVYYDSTGTAIAMNATQAKDPVKYILENEASNGFCYIMNKNTDGTATLNVYNIPDNEAEELVVVANAVEFFGVTVNKKDIVVSSDDISKKTVNKVEQFVLEDITTTVDKGTVYDDLYFALDTDDEDLIIPTEITVKMGGKELTKGVHYTWTPETLNGVAQYVLSFIVTDTNNDGVEDAGDVFTKATGALEITVNASEQASFDGNVSKGLTIATADGACSVGDFKTVITASGGYALPATIDVTINGTALVKGLDYTYNSETGEIVVFDLAKGDKLVITAAGVSAYNVSFAGTAEYEYDTTVVNYGYDYSCYVSVPKSDNKDDTRTRSLMSVTVKVGNKPITTDTTAKTYYTFDEATGKLTIKNVTGRVAITANWGYEYAASADFADTKIMDQKAFEKASVELSNEVVYAANDFKTNVTVTGVTAGYEVDWTAPVVKIGDTELENTDYTFAQAKDENGQDIADTYTLTILAAEFPLTNTATDYDKDYDVTIELCAEESEYVIKGYSANVIDTFKHMTVTGAKTEYGYGESVSLTVDTDDDEHYKLPDAEDVTVKVDGEVVAGAYKLVLDEANSTTSNPVYNAVIELDGITGDIEIIGSAKVKYSAATDAVLTAATGGSSVPNVKLLTTFDGNEEFYNPTTDKEVNVYVALADSAANNAEAFKFDMTAAVVKMGGNEVDEKSDYDTEVKNKKTAYDAAVEAYADDDGSDPATTKTLYDAMMTAKKNYEDAVAADYYEFDGTCITVYNATDYVEVAVVATKKTGTDKISVANKSVTWNGDTAGSPADMTKDISDAYIVTEAGQTTYWIDAEEFGMLDESSTAYACDKIVVTDANGNYGEIEAEEGADGTTVVAYKITGFTTWTGVTLTVNLKDGNAFVPAN